MSSTSATSPITPGGPVTTSSITSNLEGLQNLINQLLTDIQSLQSQIADLEAELGSLRPPSPPPSSSMPGQYAAPHLDTSFQIAMRTYERRRNELETQLAGLRSQLSAKEAALSRAEGDLEQARADAAARAAQLQNQIDEQRDRMTEIGSGPGSHYAIPEMVERLNRLTREQRELAEADEAAAEVLAHAETTRTEADQILDRAELLVQYHYSLDQVADTERAEAWDDILARPDTAYALLVDGAELDPATLPPIDPDDVDEEALALALPIPDGVWTQLDDIEDPDERQRMISQLSGVYGAAGAAQRTEGLEDDIATLRAVQMEQARIRFPELVAFLEENDFATNQDLINAFGTSTQLDDVCDQLISLADEAGLDPETLNAGRVLDHSDVHILDFFCPLTPDGRLPTTVAEANAFHVTEFFNEQYNPDSPFEDWTMNCGPAALVMNLEPLGLLPSALNPEQKIDYARALMLSHVTPTSVLVLAQDGDKTEVMSFADQTAANEWMTTQINDNPDHTATYQTIPQLDYDRHYPWDGDGDGLNDRSGTSINAVQNGAVALGVNAHIESGWTALDNALATGSPAVLFGNMYDSWVTESVGGVKNETYGSYAARGAHFVAVLGRTEDGRYLVSDPMFTGGPVAMTREALARFGNPPGMVVVERPRAPTEPDVAPLP